MSKITFDFYSTNPAHYSEFGDDGCKVATQTVTSDEENDIRVCAAASIADLPPGTYVGIQRAHAGTGDVEGWGWIVNIEPANTKRIKVLT